MTDVEMLTDLGALPQVVKRLFEAVARRDQVALLEAYHPDITIHEAASLPYGGDYHGHEEPLHMCRLSTGPGKG